MNRVYDLFATAALTFVPVWLFFALVDFFADRAARRRTPSGSLAETAEQLARKRRAP